MSPGSDLCNSASSQHSLEAIYFLIPFPLLEGGKLIPDIEWRWDRTEFQGGQLRIFVCFEHKHSMLLHKFDSYLFLSSDRLFHLTPPKYSLAKFLKNCRFTKGPVDITLWLGTTSSQSCRHAFQSLLCPHLFGEC